MIEKREDDRTIRLSDDVTWIGVLDYDIRTFDIVMHTGYGTTYNSYFINAEKKAVVEIAKEKFSETYLRKLRSVTDPSTIEYIILDHTEPDHSGSLGLLLDLAPSATVVGSGNAIRYMEDIVNRPFKSMVVRDGDVLDLGNRKLRFISAPNLHWPDSIYTYLEEEKILFTCDSFGAHYCDYGMYSSLTPEYVSTYKYYFDVILKPFSKFMLKALEKIKPLEVSLICPGHGPIHRDNIREVTELTEKYALEYLEQISPKPVKKVFIAYVSAYGYTAKAAGLIASGIRDAGGIDVEVADIETMPAAELDARLTVADAILAGSPTINQNTLLPVYTLFALVNPLRDKGKPAGAFGSFGWSGEATAIILNVMKSLKLDVFEGPASFKFRPGGSKEEMLKEYGRSFGRKVLGL